MDKIRDWLDGISDKGLDGLKWGFIIAGGLLGVLASIFGEVLKDRKFDSSLKEAIKNKVDRVM